MHHMEHERDGVDLITVVGGTHIEPIDEGARIGPVGRTEMPLTNLIGTAVQLGREDPWDQAEDEDREDRSGHGVVDMWYDGSWGWGGCLGGARGWHFSLEELPLPLSPLKEAILVTTCCR